MLRIIRDNVHLIILFIIFFLLICSGFFLDSYGKYYTNSDSSRGIKIANWGVTINGVSSGNLEINLNNYIDSSNKYSTTSIIPGSSGVIPIVIDATDADVALDYSIIIDSSNLPDNLKLYSDADYTQELDEISGLIGITDSKKQTFNIYWKWNYTTTDETSSWSSKDLSFSLAIDTSQRIDGDV